MPWDTIRPANYQIYANIDPFLYPIREAHESRIKNNPDFVYFQAIADRNKLFAERSHISLNEQERRDEKSEDDKWRLNLENDLRKAKGKELANDLEELEELEEQESEEEREEDELTSEDDLEKIEDDALIKEAGFIALDLIDTATPIASTN